MRAEQSWSLMDPKPVLLYLEQHEEYIVYWNSIAMTHSQALCIAMEYSGIYPTPEMKQQMQFTFDKLYYANAFGTRAWDDMVKGRDVYSRQRAWMRDHLKALFEGKDPKEILAWFDYKRARIESVDRTEEVSYTNSSLT